MIFQLLCISDYLKGIQAMEIFALISSVTAIGVWMVYIYIAMSTRTRKGVACTVFKIITIVLVMLTGESFYLFIRFSSYMNSKKLMRSLKFLIK